MHQVQLTQPKGNRWLYRLPKPYFEHVLDCLSAAFVGIPLWVIDGESAAQDVWKCYRESEKPADFWDTTAREKNVAYIWRKDKKS